MKLHPYAEVDPTVLRSQVEACIVGRHIATLALPLVITDVDEKTLIVGNADEERFKLPDTLLVASRCAVVEADPVAARINQFFRFAFKDAPTVPYAYQGLIRYKVEEDRVITPVIVELPFSSDSPQMQRSNSWATNARNNRDHRWMSRDELNALANESDIFTENTSLIINHFIHYPEFVK